MTFERQLEDIIAAPARDADIASFSEKVPLLVA